MGSFFDELGGDRLRTILVDFYDRIFADVMIGFLFHGKDKQRLIDKEWEFAAGLLGGTVSYTGKSMPKAHASSPILGGHFDRRQQILRETLADHKVADAVVQHWINHNESLRRQITADRGSECNHERVSKRLTTVED